LHALRSPSTRRTGRPAAEPAGPGALAELADASGSPRAHLLAARLALPSGAAGPGHEVRTRLRLALAGPAPEIVLGTLGHAQAMVLLAELLPPGDAEALELAATAADLLAPLRVAGWSARARALLPVTSPPGRGARSTATADHVWSLVGEGLTNRQISARLSLSEKSVEGYITRLLRAHGCANRAELAARRSEEPPSR
jgi:DNA-binding NarL/FixJ family response regulator